MKTVREFILKLFAPPSKSLPIDTLHGWEKINALLHNLTASRAVPGVSATLIKNGKIMLQNGYGYANIEKGAPMDAKHSICRIASISKCITGLALGKMVEEGILDWEDSLYDHVPYFPEKTYDFTLRQLAAHTAGIRGYRGKEFGLNKPYGIKDSLLVFKNDPLEFEPGTGYLYNSFDFVLLSLAMQEASGVPFESYVKTHVLDPLGMENTISPRSWDNHSNTFGNSKACQYYTKSSTGFKKAMSVDNFYKLAGGGYLSTSTDIAKLGQEILEQRLLSPTTYKTLLTSQEVHGKPTYYGLGFQVSMDKEGRPFYGHVGNSVGVYSNLFVYPEEELVVSLLINATDPRVQDTLDSIPNWAT